MPLQAEQGAEEAAASKGTPTKLADMVPGLACWLAKAPVMQELIDRAEELFKEQMQPILQRAYEINIDAADVGGPGGDASKGSEEVPPKTGEVVNAETRARDDDPKEDDHDLNCEALNGFFLRGRPGLRL